MFNFWWLISFYSKEIIRSKICKETSLKIHHLQVKSIQEQIVDATYSVVYDCFAKSAYDSKDHLIVVNYCCMDDLNCTILYIHCPFCLVFRKMVLNQVTLNHSCHQTMTLLAPEKKKISTVSNSNQISSTVNTNKNGLFRLVLLI